MKAEEGRIPIISIIYLTLVFYIIRKMNHQAVTEFEVLDCGYGDVLDLDTMTDYEIETLISHP